MYNFSNFTREYIALLTKVRNANKDALVKAAKSKEGKAYEDLENKIITRLTNQVFDDTFTFTSILESVQAGDPCMVAHFSIDPGRQNLSEPFQKEFAKKENGRILEKEKGHRYVQYDGEIVESKKKKNKNSNTSKGAPKSIDFKTTINGKVVYATAKVTNCHYNGKVRTGGTQTTIKEEMKQTAEAYDRHLKANPSAAYDFMLLLDGSYFTKENRAEVKLFANNNPRIHVLTSDELATLNI